MAFYAVNRSDIVEIIKCYKKGTKNWNDYKGNNIKTASKAELKVWLGEVGLVQDGGLEDILAILDLEAWDDISNAQASEITNAVIAVIKKKETEPVATTPSTSKKRKNSEVDNEVWNRALQVRLEELDSNLCETKYTKAKEKLKVELVKFLAQLSTPRSLEDATPFNLRQFLIWKEKNGKTQVHLKNCVRRLGFQSGSCGCPYRMASSSVDSLIGQLRAIFRDYGRGSDWCLRLGVGNPLASPAIKNHLRAVRVEQARSLLIRKKSPPVFLNKIIRMCRSLQYDLEKATLSWKSRYCLLRDKAYFKLMCYTGDRAGDVGRLKTSQVRWLPDHSGLYIHMSEGKTISGTPRRLIIPRLEQREYCPVSELECYIEECMKLGIDLKTGFLFRPTCSGKSLVKDTPVTSSAMNPRLRKHLSEVGLWNGETPHGIRSGCAISLRQKGVNDSDIISHVGWNSVGMLAQYSIPHAVVNQSNNVHLLASNSNSDQIHSGAVTMVSNLLQNWKELDIL